MKFVKENASKLPLKEILKILELKHINYYLYEIEFDENNIEKIIVKKSFDQLIQGRTVVILLKDFGNTLFTIDNIDSKYFFNSVSIKKYDQDYVKIVEDFISTTKSSRFHIMESDYYDNIKIIEDTNGNIYSKNDPELDKLFTNKYIENIWGIDSQNYHINKLNDKIIITKEINLWSKYKRLSTIYVESENSSDILDFIKNIEFRYIRIKDVVGYRKPLKERILNLDDKNMVLPYSYQKMIPKELYDYILSNGPSDDIFFIECVYNKTKYYLGSSSCKGLSKSRFLFNASRSSSDNMYFEDEPCFIAYHPNYGKGALTKNWFEEKIWYKKGENVNMNYIH